VNRVLWGHGCVSERGAIASHGSTGHLRVVSVAGGGHRRGAFPPQMGHRARARADEFSSNAKNPTCIGVSHSGPNLIVMISQASTLIPARMFLRSSLWRRIGFSGKEALLCSGGHCENLVGWSSGL